MRILLVEDDPNDLEFALRAFKKLPDAHDVCVARDGDEAIRFLLAAGSHMRAHEGEAGLVLLDLKLPGRSGLDVLARVKHDRHARRIPVVMLTGSNDDRDLDRASWLGAVGVLVKPVDPGRLAEVVRAVAGPRAPSTALH